VRPRTVRRIMTVAFWSVVFLWAVILAWATGMITVMIGVIFFGGIISSVAVDLTRGFRKV